MAEIRTAAGGTITDPGQVRSFLATLGIEFSAWGTDRVPKTVAAKSLSAEEKQAILAAYKPEIDELIARRGYVTADMVSLSPDTPNLDGMLATFLREHFHTDDEVRFTVAGRGTFYFRDRDGRPLECEVHPGDLIVVPANTWHWFALCDDRQIACVRVFKTKEGWVAQFKDEGARVAV